jgi:ribosomal protein S24E
VEIKISKENYNPLLKRKEITFSVKHPSTGTPPRFELRKELAAKLKATLDQTFIINLKTKTGTKEAVGEAQIYDSVERAKSILAEHLTVRNLPPEERKKLAEAKAAKPEKKPEEKKKAEQAKPAGETK